MDQQQYPSAAQVQTRGRFGKYLTNALMVSDFLILNLVFAVVLWINPDAWHGHVRLMGLVVNVSYIPAAILMRPVRALRSTHMDRLVQTVVYGLMLDLLLFLALNFFLSMPWAGWQPYTEMYVGWLVALPLWCVVSRLMVKSMRRRGHNYSRVVIVGTGPTAARLYEELKFDPGYGYKIMGFFDNECPSHFPYRGYYEGDLSELQAFVSGNCIDQVFYTLSGDDDQSLRTALRAADAGMAQFSLVPQVTRYLKRPFAMDRLGSVPVLSLKANPLASSALKRFMKRSMDIAVSGTFLLFSPLIFVPVAIAIKLGSPGPVFFRQKRTGLKGRDFECLKFRTMRVNADADKLQATRNDPRKTRIGDFLRRTSIDELPQFINVFRGDMSVVGPRPHMLRHTEEYSNLIEKYMVRHMVRPGITGWAQVNGYRGQTKHLWQMEKRVEYDNWYIENWSFMLDVKIVVLTFINLFRHEEGAF